MKYNLKNLEDLKKSGVYAIKNISTGKMYIGSTKMTFQKRLQHHVSLLRINKHKNKYLQNAYNKHTEYDFEILILEITNKNDTLQKEQYYLDNNINLYNINPLATGTPNLSLETIEKRRQTMIKKFANGELNYMKDILKSNIPWNKGLTINDIDYSFLKVKKTITKSLKQAHKNTSIRNRKNSPEVYVYDYKYNLLGNWNSAKDLEEWSETELNKLPINSRFKVERMGIPVNHLKSVNINKACKTNKSYKGIYFSYKPLHQVIGDK